jgi:hypothetical protein
MGIPEEDLGPRWLRDYGSLYGVVGISGAGGDSGTGVKVDMPAMKDFAAALRKSLQDDYGPHAHKVFDDMTAPVVPSDGFLDLQLVLEQHREVQSAATNNVANHGNGALIFANAADEISNRYQSSDAYVAAQMADVYKYLGMTPAQATTINPATTDPTADPPEGV